MNGYNIKGSNSITLFRFCSQQESAIRGKNWSSFQMLYMEINRKSLMLSPFEKDGREIWRRTHGTITLEIHVDTK